MIILLTGKPGAGKSTVIEKFIALNKEPARWVVTSAILRPELGDRGGFVAANSDGVRRVISHKTDIASDVVVGENHVDLAAVDVMFANALDKATKSQGGLTIVDEIGPIQLLSPAFTAALGRVFDSPADLVVTIHYNDERLAVYRNAARNLVLEVTTNNRDELPSVLVFITRNRAAYNALSASRQELVGQFIRRYVASGWVLQIKKLMGNALLYVTQGLVTQEDTTHWSVRGKRGMYHVVQAAANLTCTCDLYAGRGIYAHNAGECSHIQAVAISQV